MVADLGDAEDERTEDMATTKTTNAIEYAAEQGRKDRAHSPEPSPMNRYLLTENALVAAGFTRADILAMSEEEYATRHMAIQDAYNAAWR